VIHGQQAPSQDLDLRTCILEPGPESIISTVSAPW